ncbi:MAG TPA: BlaI/MecI/CopY family transcriptional regulator [Phycisphaerae bacterium]|nr:BlaI/MecI/CopY family transcriptional regulator [Phycisphaerae bacterium]HOB74495.1 BlaI/MecI/CopY family transcriptional regulator [Phycisphaerae bacterium]HOJ56804.1 BlaI/MecI/CopY family transcriptional regulator [Phycisphaerae bacterium]HOL28544.1 BlaI/MecI/CopY family transcriptional regulator [Phycisphaerae bacterium]HPP23060.1 BlaI/MecI/CopY family transcriptional regulator [Phycisphaerae bacterium]
MPRPGLGQAEWEVLRYVGEHHPVTVREVAEHMAAHKGHARTTVLTVMERLRAKGYLVRRKQGGVYRYSPKKPLAELTQGLVANFVDNVLNGMLSPFFAYLSRSDKISDEQLEELKKLVRELESQRGEETK